MQFPYKASPLAHTRFEYLDESFFPRVRMLVRGEDFRHWDRLIDSEGLRISSQRSHSYAFGLFIDFIEARGAEFLGKETHHYPQLFISFSDALLMGTVNKGQCPYNLWWLPRTASATNKILRAVTRVLNWFADDVETPSIVPKQGSTVAEKAKFWSRWNILKERSLLGHLRTRERARHSQHMHATNAKRDEVSLGRAPKRFPHEKFRDLLNQGFVRKPASTWSKLRDQMVLLLLHGGGLRISEALSLWVSDVFYENPDDPSQVIVRLYDPHEGRVEFIDGATNTPTSLTRAAFLKLKHDKLPLSMEPGNRRIGSKPNFYPDRHGVFTLVFWRDPSFSRAFKQLRDQYVRLRPRPDNHPFLFVTPEGRPMTVKGYEKVHAAAVRRIGLIPSKALGTTPHGHRHDYVYTLRDAGLSEKVIQLACHHRSAFSQESYGEKSLLEVQHEIRKKIPSSTMLFSEGKGIPA